MIQQRHTHFERHGHACAVGITQQTLADEIGELQRADGGQITLARDQVTQLAGAFGGEPVVEIRGAGKRQRTLHLAREDRIRDLIHADAIAARAEQVCELAPACLGRNLAAGPHQHARRHAGDAAQQTRRQMAEDRRGGTRARQVHEARVASEQLVAAGAGERHRQAGLAHGAADEIRVQRVEGGLVQAFDRVVEMIRKPLLRQQHLTMIRAEQMGDVARIGRLIELRLFKPDVERHHRPARVALSHGSDHR